jgi:CDP-diacylglycerol--serine O-phosphatidyltransferase
VVLAAVLDLLDGPLARRLSCCGPFGSQLDSLADLIAFGVAPAYMLYLSVLNDVPVLGAAACLAFVLCGAWRLARFPLVQEPNRFVGLPIPPAGVTAAILAVLAPAAGLALAATVALMVLMVGVTPFPTLSTVGRVIRRDRPLDEDESTPVSP